MSHLLIAALYLGLLLTICPAFYLTHACCTSDGNMTGIDKADNVLFGKVTYIYLMDRSQSSKDIDVSACGNRNRDPKNGRVLDCEIAAVEIAQETILEKGNVDLVGLVTFDSGGMNWLNSGINLVQPWAKKKPISCDSYVVEVARTITASGNTNFEEGIKEACKVARSPQNTNPKTVIIMVSDGKPNMGNSVLDTARKNCNNATIQSFAVTPAADCLAVDSQLAVGANPDNLFDILAATGDTCRQVPDVTDLPELFRQLERSTWDGIQLFVNNVFHEEATNTIKYPVEVPFEGPKATTYTGGVDLGPGEYNLCMTASSSTSGNAKYIKHCKNAIILTVIGEPLHQVKSSEKGELEASFSVTLGTAPDQNLGNNVIGNQNVVIKICDGAIVSEQKTDPNGKVTYTYRNDRVDRTTTEDCFESFFFNDKGNTACAKTSIEWQVCYMILSHDR